MDTDPIDIKDLSSLDHIGKVLKKNALLSAQKINFLSRALLLPFFVPGIKKKLRIARKEEE